MAERDFKELVEGTVDEVKEAVEEEGLDPERVLEAERENKDRVTLIEWLEEREKSTDGPEELEMIEFSGKSRLPALAAGVLIGAALVAALAFSGVYTFNSGGGGASSVAPSDVSSDLDTYLQNNIAALNLPPGSSIEVSNVQSMEGSELYEATVRIQASLGNQTLDQDTTVYVTPNGRFVFFSSPLDTSVSVTSQTQRQAPR